jgi:hypothetical protein
VKFRTSVFIGPETRGQDEPGHGRG